MGSWRASELALSSAQLARARDRVSPSYLVRVWSLACHKEAEHALAH